jgi:S-adenosylmethionine:tRNA ribosyltransferase-isomerase
MKTGDFDYYLPPELVAQRPLPQRDASRLLIYHRPTGHIEQRQFTALLDYLQPGDVLVLNDSRVIPARLFGRKASGGKVEILLLQQLAETRWQGIVGGRKVTAGTTITIYDKQGAASEIVGEVTAVLPGSQREITFNQPLDDYWPRLGYTPLPPYIHQALDDPERYQTIYARPPGSAAAPTAGLHFTPELLLALRQKGILLEVVTLHVGLDTFKPVEAEEVQQHTIHSEWARLTPETARRINEAKLAGGRLAAVGTTAVRTLETAALRSAGIYGSLQTISQRDAAGETAEICPWKPVAAFEGPTDLFIYPGYRFRAVEALITNFHLPRSSLIMLVAAFMGQEEVKRVYETAVQEKYRFYSFGDALLIL